MRLAALVLVLAAQVGCAQYMVIKAPGPIDRNVLQPGAERTRIAATFGAPIVTNDTAPGKVIDTYNYEDGGKRNTTLPKAGRVILYTAGDVFTLFLDQVLWIPAEILMDGTEYSANVEYQQRASDGQWIALRITETKMAGDKAVRVLELDPSAAAALFPPAVPASAQTGAGSGTCFAISGDGRVLTASHVVGGNTAWVVLADGRQLSATVERRAVAFDIVLLRVNAETTHYLSLGDARALQVGQRAFVLGYAGEAPASDASLIDASIASLTGPDGDPTYVGMQVPVQPESSGEPLVDERGQVVGIVTANGPLLPASAGAGTAPEANNHAVSAEYVSPFVGSMPSLPPTPSYDEAVARARAALCRVQTEPPAVEKTEAPPVATPTAEAANSQ